MSTRLVVLDIGVRGGPNPRWLPFANDVTVVGVDADAAECARLTSQPSPLPVRYLPYALGSADQQQATLRLTRQRGCSSILEPNFPFLASFPYGRAFEIETTVPVTLTRLDTMCRKEDVRPDVIKIDTQGSELDILRGGEQALSSACLVETEVEFNPIYSGQPLFGDVDAYLRQRGFALLGLRRDYWRRTTTKTSSLGGTLIHGDALFYRLDVPAEQRRRFAIALTAYNQLDFVEALGLQAPAPAPGSFVQRMVGTVLSSVRDHRGLRRWLDLSRPGGATDWHDPEYF